MLLRVISTCFYAPLISFQHTPPYKCVLADWIFKNPQTLAKVKT